MYRSYACMDMVSPAQPDMDDWIAEVFQWQVPVHVLHVDVDSTGCAEEAWLGISCCGSIYSMT